MDITAEDEKKPFEVEGTGQEEDNQPDPDEQLMLDQGNGRVWLVKIPKTLMERWSSIDQDGVHLATVRVYDGVNGGKTRIVLFLPPAAPDPADATTQQPPRDPTLPIFAPDQFVTSVVPTPPGEPDMYELDVVNEAVENQIVVAERPKDRNANPLLNRARSTILTGRVKHDCNLRPLFTQSYRRHMRERFLKYNTPKRQIRMIEDAGVAGGRGGINRLSSGVGVNSGNAFSDLIKTKPKPAKGTFERMARMPRNDLLDMLFSLFRQSPRWSAKSLREKTQQPEVYLKEVLNEVAFQHRSGEFNTLWELKATFKDDGGNDAGPSSLGAMKMEGEEEEEDDDDDDEGDMEEVS